MTFVHIMKYLFVSRGQEGPINFSHHPGLGLLSVLWAWEEAERPVCNNIALDLSALSVPQVSYAMSYSGKTPPQSKCKCSLEWNFSVAPLVYDGSGPDFMDLADSLAVLTSRASRQGKDIAGFEASPERRAGGVWSHLCFCLGAGEVLERCWRAVECRLVACEVDGFVMDRAARAAARGAVIVCSRV